MSEIHSKDLRTKRFRCTEFARYSFEDTSAALKKFVLTDSESASMVHYEDQLRDVELVCAKDHSLCVRLNLTLKSKNHTYMYAYMTQILSLVKISS